MEFYGALKKWQEDTGRHYSPKMGSKTGVFQVSSMYSSKKKKTL